MKKFVLLSVLFGLGSLMTFAQDDDMYFVPTQKNLEREYARLGMPSDTYYSGSSRSSDEYNRRGSSYQSIGGDGNDIINFSAEQGVYPDSTADYSITKNMSRWDGYTPTDAYWQGYERGRDESWFFEWHSPWYASYYPWYDSYWYWDNWRYPWYSAWRYDPWYPYHHHYVGHGFGGTVYGGGGVVSSRSTVGAGTINRYGRTSNNRVASSNVRNRTVHSVSTSSSPSISYGSSGGERSYSYGSSSSSSSSSVGSYSGGGGGGGSRSYSGGGGSSSRHR